MVLAYRALPERPTPNTRDRLVALNGKEKSVRRVDADGVVGRREADRRWPNTILSVGGEGHQDEAGQGQQTLKEQGADRGWLED